MTTIIGTSAGQRTIEQHKLMNHTECHCVDRDDIMQQHSPIVTKSEQPSGSFSPTLSPSPLTRMGGSSSTIPGLRCPRLFEKVLENDVEWRCDCSSGNIDCKIFQNGGEHFSMDDRK